MSEERLNEELERLRELAAQTRAAQRAAEEAQAARDQAILRAIRSGATLAQIGAATGLAPSSITYLSRRRLNLPPRPRGRKPRAAAPKE